jgi:predicted nucleic-acid-binding protein
VKVIADTNLLLRAAVRDNPAEGDIASQLLSEAEFIVIPTIVLCEMVWVLRRVYKFSAADIGQTVRILTSQDNVKIDRAVVAAGLEILEAGGDFADGVIAYEGKWLGGEVFASFDKDAIALLKSKGHKTQLL